MPATQTTRKPKDKVTFGADFKRFFIRGLGVLLPSVLTLWIVWQAYLFVERQVAEPINRGIRTAVLWVIPRTFEERKLPDWFVVTDEQERQFRFMLEKQATLQSQALQQLSQAELKAELRAQHFKRFWDSHWYFRFIGLFVAITLIYLAGLILGGYLGRRLYHKVERLITRVPVLKQVYPHVKQVVDMIFGEKRVAFKKVVLVEYPRKGIWSIGFLTGAGMKSVYDEAGEAVLTVFIPSTPTPFTGFTITVKESEAPEMALSVDEALRFLLTGGVLVPPRQVLPAADTIGSGAGPALAAATETGPTEQRRVG